MTKGRRKARRIHEYTHDPKHPEIPTPWLREKIGLLRAEKFDVKSHVDNHTWRNWRKQAGISANAKYCTQQQAVQIVTISLWKPGNAPYLKDLLGSELTTQQLDEISVSKSFNAWIDLNGAHEAAQLLEEIFSIKQHQTGAELEKISRMITGKIIPVSNLSRAIKETIRRDRPCSREVTRKAIAWMVDLRLKRERQNSQQKSVSVYQACLTAS